MSEYTREEILRLIEENGGPEGLDLSGKDLSGIDLSREAVEGELEKYREMAPDEIPVWYSKLSGGVSLVRANLQEAYLRGAELQGANLVDADLQGADLVGAKLQEAILLVANLRGAVLTQADLQEADLRGANLEKAFFLDSNLKGAYFYRAFLNDTQMERKTIGDAIGEELVRVYVEAKEAYLALKNNFAKIGRYRDESWAYVKERQMGKMCSAPWRAREFYGKSQLGDSKESRLPTRHPRVVWFYTRRTLKWLADWFVELLCDYGESLWRVLAWMLLVILGFAAYYQLSHAVVTSSQDAATSLWDHLIFSLGAFTTLQPARLQAARPGVELLTTIQAIIGISLAGLLGFVAGNRIRRS